jgi:hypothetical protein
MEFPPSTFTSRLSTSALQLIDRPFDHRPIGKERFDKSPDLVGQMKKTLPKLTEFFSIPLALYAHDLIAYRYPRKDQEKNEHIQKIFSFWNRKISQSPEQRSLAGLRGAGRSPFRYFLLSESQGRC